MKKLKSVSRIILFFTLTCILPSVQAYSVGICGKIALGIFSLMQVSESVTVQTLDSMGEVDASLQASSDGYPVDSCHDDSQCPNNEKGNTEDAAHREYYRELIGYLEKGYKELTSSHLDNVLILVGASGAGKSTIANVLIGNTVGLQEIVSKNDEENPYEEENSYEEVKEYKMVVIKEIVNGPKIGDSSISETLWPQPYIPQGFFADLNITIYDCPGFKDNRGEDILLATCALNNILVKLATGIRGIVFVCDYNQLISNRGIDFIEGIVEIIKELFGSNDSEVKPDSLGSMFLLFNKVPDGVSNALIWKKLNKMKNDYNQLGTENLRKSVPYLEALMKNIGTIRPNRDHKSFQKDLDNVKKVFSSLKGIEKDKFGFMGTEGTKRKLKDFILYVRSKYKSDLNYIINESLNSLRSINNTIEKLQEAHKKNELFHKKDLARLTEEEKELERL